MMKTFYPLRTSLWDWVLKIMTTQLVIEYIKVHVKDIPLNLISNCILISFKICVICTGMGHE